MQLEPRKRPSLYFRMDRLALTSLLLGGDPGFWSIRRSTQHSKAAGSWLFTESKVDHIRWRERQQEVGRERVYACRERENVETREDKMSALYRKELWEKGKPNVVGKFRAESRVCQPCPVAGRD